MPGKLLPFLHHSLSQQLEPVSVSPGSGGGVRCECKDKSPQTFLGGHIQHFASTSSHEYLIFAFLSTFSSQQFLFLPSLLGFGHGVYEVEHLFDSP